MDKEFEQAEATRSAKQRQEDIDQINQERAGIETSRIPKTGLLKAKHEERQREKEHNSRLNSQLLSQAYQDAHDRTLRLLNDTEDLLYQALIQSKDDLFRIQTEHETLLDKAITLPNGDKAFISEQGEVYNENGERLEIEDVQAIYASHPNAPSWEAFLASKEALIVANDKHDQLLIHEERLVELREELEDENTPPSMDRLESITQELRDVSMQISPKPDHDVALEVSHTQPVKVPDLSL
ncbi:hypothetical protein DS891_01365 [Pseudoalteromonas sp. JC28]|uniref:hypothetical protein n=1 Tax=Pseudoalteromonas sp. JC28 TaxID=2267617 RepID=UPI0015737C7D|nr:hypothetical protein [Pseudoalteromonas sp. JC28]NSY32257.1 hypothetical protein [Pseudoalteromonas sp. JC28]